MPTPLALVDCTFFLHHARLASLETRSIGSVSLMIVISQFISYVMLEFSLQVHSNESFPRDDKISIFCFSLKVIVIFGKGWPSMMGFFLPQISVCLLSLP